MKIVYDFKAGNQKGIAPIIIIIIAAVAIAAAAGGYFVWKDFTNTNMKDIIYLGNSVYSGWSENQMRADCLARGGNFNPCGSACLDKDQPCVKVCAPRCEFNQAASKTTSSVIDISTWKTYRNEKYGFEVRYPANWEVVVEKNLDEKVSLELYVRQARENVSGGIGIFVAAVDYIDKFYKTASVISSPVINDRVWTEFIFSPVKSGLGLSPTRGVGIKVRQYSYYLVGATDNTEFNKILSTFKFIK